MKRGMFGLILAVTAVLVIGSGASAQTIFNETFTSDGPGSLHTVGLASGYTWSASGMIVDDSHVIDVGNSVYAEAGTNSAASNVPTLPHTRQPGEFFRATMVIEINHSFLNPPSGPFTQNTSLLLNLREEASGGDTQGQAWVMQSSLAVGGGLGNQVDRGGTPFKNGPNEWWSWEAGEGGALGTDMLGKMTWMIEIHDDFTEAFYDLHDGGGFQLRRHTDHTGSTETMMTLESVDFNTGGNSTESPFPKTYVDSILIEVIPEPATLGLMGLGSLMMLRRRR